MNFGQVFLTSQRPVESVGRIVVENLTRFKFGEPLCRGHYHGQVMNCYYCGDNLQILREQIKDEWVDFECQ